MAAVLVPAALVVGVGGGLASSAGSATPAGAAQGAHAYNDGGMIGFGSVGLTNPSIPQPLNSPVFSGVATDDGNGYVLASADGGVFAYGDASFEGSAGSLPLQGPIVAMGITPDAKGYWLGAARWRCLRLRRRGVLRLHGWHAPQPADRRHDGDA